MAAMMQMSHCVGVRRGADVFDNAKVAKRNLLYGPSTWGVNLGVHKDFHLGDRVTATLGADVQNLFNHRLLSPNVDDGGGGGSFANLGSFTLDVDPATLQDAFTLAFSREEPGLPAVRGCACEGNRQNCPREPDQHRR